MHHFQLTEQVFCSLIVTLNIQSMYCALWCKAPEALGYPLLAKLSIYWHNTSK